MSKKARPRSLNEHEAIATAIRLRTGHRKLNLLAQQIRGLDVNKALADLTFSKKRIAKDVKKALQSAIANAENNHQLDVDRLFVAEATVGKSMMLRRMHARARGRGSRINKYYSRLRVVVAERQEA